MSLKDLNTMEEKTELTKNKHAAAIDDGRVVVSGRRWSSRREGAETIVTTYYSHTTALNRVVCRGESIADHCYIILSILQRVGTSYRHHEQSLTSKRSKSFSMFFLHRKELKTHVSLHMNDSHEHSLNTELHIKLSIKG